MFGDRSFALQVAKFIASPASSLAPIRQHLGLQGYVACESLCPRDLATEINFPMAFPSTLLAPCVRGVHQPRLSECEFDTPSKQS